MRMEHRAAVFGMELRADVPAQGGYLDDFHQVGLRIDARTLHAGCLVLGLVVVVELIAVAVTLLDVLRAVSLVSLAALLQDTFVGAQTHGAAHVGDGLLLLHDVDDVMRCFFVHFAAVSVGQSQDIPCELDGHALHAQTDAERRDVVSAGVLDGDKLAGDAPLAESRSYQYARLVFQGFGYVVVRQLLAVHEVYGHLAIVVGTRLRQGFADGLVGVLQVVLAHQCDVYRFGTFRFVTTFQEAAPRTEARRVAYGKSHLLQDGSVQLLLLHQDGHFVDSRRIDALHHGFHIHVAELGHLLAEVQVQLMLRAQYQDIRLDAGALQFLHRVLGRLGLQLARGG